MLLKANVIFTKIFYDVSAFFPDGRGEIGYDGDWHHNEALKKARYLLDNADTVRDTVLMMLIDSTEDQSSIKVESQMRPFATD